MDENTRRKRVGLLLGLLTVFAGLSFGESTPTEKQKNERSIPNDSVDDLHALARRIERGKTVYVTERSGAEVKGKIVSMSGDELTLERVEKKVVTSDSEAVKTKAESLSIPMDEVRTLELETRGSGWKGALIGGGVFAGLFALGASQCDQPDCSGGAYVGPMAAAGALVGAGVGFLTAKTTKGRTLVYRSEEESALEVRAIPILTRHEKGLVLSLSF